MPIFAVIRTRGSAWQESQSLEGQPEWTSHAAFMNGLAKDRFVMLEGSADVLLIINAGTAEEIRSRLAEDPWSRQDLLRIARITPWTLRLGSLE